MTMTFKAIGPFPHGTRETGYDPLSAYGKKAYLRRAFDI